MLDLIKFLAQYPQGTSMYSKMFGVLYLCSSSNTIICKDDDGNLYHYDSNGKLLDFNSKPDMLRPSYVCEDWYKFIVCLPYESVMFKLSDDLLGCWRLGRFVNKSVVSVNNVVYTNVADIIPTRFFNFDNFEVL